MEQKLGIESSGETRGEIVSRSSPFDDIPEDCVSYIVSLTSPRDACVVASVSKTFRLTVESDSVWEKFLPPEYSSLILGLQVFSSKKVLYFVLCDEPILIEDGQKYIYIFLGSFWLEKASGKKCIMLSAKKLAITWGSSPQYWQWISIPESRFGKVPELLDVCAFEIRGWMNTRILSPRTRYSAYVVYKTRNGCHGFRDLPIQVGIGLLGQTTNKRFICFDESSDRIKKRELMKSKMREDGWIEAEIGDFFNERGSSLGCDEIELSIVDITSPYWKRGLIIQGIEFRPAK
ncbi:LOW QUALITY PROTEIN: F-box protein At2g02240 [Eutrema salsugineum]|uniref:LOW QUALITY PROTEIN: F-box protein At2g02240 n=1 Tax=Eutrema salsugineum TaxID=72664 RepID=UPI000CED3784|nr:LOW QUALITY PROTEIN: F-box protein At2g02240 [Eutrema salsugineum]